MLNIFPPIQIYECNLLPLVSVNQFEPLSQEISRSFIEGVASMVKGPRSVFPPIPLVSILYGLDLSTMKGFIEEKTSEQVEDCEVM